jgi:hypothetical protein
MSHERRAGRAHRSPVMCSGCGLTAASFCAAKGPARPARNGQSVRARPASNRRSGVTRNGDVERTERAFLAFL